MKLLHCKDKGLYRYKDIIIDNMRHGIIRKEDNTRTIKCSLCNKSHIVSKMIWYANGTFSYRDLACYDCILHNKQIYICALCLELQLITEEDEHMPILEYQRTICTFCKNDIKNDRTIKTSKLYNRKEVK